jgi:hypothetical protein
VSFHSIALCILEPDDAGHWSINACGAYLFANQWPTDDSVPLNQDFLQNPNLIETTRFFGYSKRVKELSYAMMCKVAATA